MRRKAGTLTPIEAELLEAAIELHIGNNAEFHGWQLAKARDGVDEHRRPIAFGSLYRALDRLEQFGYLSSRLEDAAVAEAERRPRRRLYQVTALGYRADLTALVGQPSGRAPALRLAGGGATS